MLVNLKRLYVRMRSFPQARFISGLLLTVDPSAIVELRDRGLLAYHLQDFAGALRDLEAYLRLLPKRTVSTDDPNPLASDDEETRRPTAPTASTNRSGNTSRHSGSESRGSTETWGRESLKSDV